MHNAIELNLNFWETNLINIFILISILLYGNKVSFSKTLENRKNKIASNIQKVEKELLLAKKFSQITEEHLKLNFIYLSKYKANYENQKKELIKIRYEALQIKLEQIFLIASELLESANKKRVANLEKYFILFILGKLLKTFISLSKDKKSQIITKIILNLEEP